MERLRPRAPLDRSRQVRPGLTVVPAVFLLLTGWMENACAHAGTFILAKCSPQPSGEVVLELTVDYSQHPILTDRAAALQALNGILQLETVQGPVALESAATAVLTESSTPDPDIPLPSDPLEAGRAHQLLIQRYQWQPRQEELRFSVPKGNPHDVLFWLAGTARDPGQSAPWRILISGDQTPPVPVAVVPLPSMTDSAMATPVLPNGPRPPSLAVRIAVLLPVLALLVAAIRWRRGRLS